MPSKIAWCRPCPAFTAARGHGRQASGFTPTHQPFLKFWEEREKTQTSKLPQESMSLNATGTCAGITSAIEALNADCGRGWLKRSEGQV